MKFTTKYKGELRTEIEHRGSGEKVITDAPLDNNGQGRFFSPTDMAASSLASCMMTIIGIRAAKSDIHINSMEADVEKVMASDPRRIGKIIVRISVNADANERQQEMLTRAAETCPVALSLHPDLIQDVKIDFE